MEQFSKIKQRIKRNAFLRSGILGGGLAVVAVSVPVVVFGLMEKAVPWLWVILGGVGLGALLFGVLLLCLYPFKKRLARRLDRTLGGEKTQTMVEFSEHEDAMSVLQRNDTEDRLGKLPKELYSFKHAWQCIVAACLAVVTAASAVTVTLLPEISGGGGDGSRPPAQEEEGDIYFSFSDYQMAALRQLINEIKTSNMAQGLKEFSIAQVEGLLEKLPTVLLRSEMVELVCDVIANVDQAVENVNTGYDLATTMTQTGQPLVMMLGNAVGCVELERFAEYYQACKEGFKPFTETVTDEGEDEGVDPRDGGEETPAEPEKGGLAKQNLTQFSIALTSALVASNVPENDALYKAVKGLHDQLFSLSQMISYFDVAGWENRMEKVFGDCMETFVNAMSAEIANDETRDYIIRKLKEVFDLKQEELPVLSRDFVPAEIDMEKENDDELNSGGLGTGDYNFPSDELIYNPATGEHVRYGELLAEYYNRYTEALKNGEIDPELEMILQAYFDMLSATQKQPNE